jgi:Protein of unknown function (DUF1997)
MSLPASQYSVLDGSKVERVGDDTFRVTVAPFQFFALVVQPVLTLQVQALPGGCCISMLACKLRGSRLIEAQNDHFAARMTNRGAMVFSICFSLLPLAPLSVSDIGAHAQRMCFDVLACPAVGMLARTSAPCSALASVLLRAFAVRNGQRIHRVPERELHAALLTGTPACSAMAAQRPATPQHHCERYDC